jgi:hypothetical protein
MAVISFVIQAPVPFFRMAKYFAQVRYSIYLPVSCKIFEHFALQADPVTEFIKLRYAPFKESTTLAPKLGLSAFFLEKQL